MIWVWDILWIWKFEEYFYQKNVCGKTLHIFYRQLDISSEPEVANEILENEPESCLTVA